MTSLVGAAAVSVLPLGAAAVAQPAGVEAAKLPALQGGDFSTATSELARRKATNAAVKEFARLEIAEQAAVAKAFGSEPGAAGIPQSKAAMLEKLQAADGATFDMMYVDGQIAEHRELLKIHQRYARSGQDPMARGASLVGVTGIETHLFLLQNIKRQL
jgi:putative membrane protein